VSSPRQSTLFLVALQFLTRLPLPSLPHFESGWLAQSLRYFPLVGAGVGLINIAVWWLASRVFPAAVAVGLMLCASLLITGAFHEDGLADACDGLGGGRTRERALEIMHDSRIGAFGALGLIVAMGLKWTTLLAFPPGWLVFAVVAAHIFSRWCALGLIWLLPYAREGEASKVQPFSGGLSVSNWILSALIAAPIPVALARWLLPDPDFRAALDDLLAALISGLVLSLGLASYFRRRLGGYTGDCLGATQQICELAILLVLLGLLRHGPMA
jgi:adenosylcobinamide-GDP ribazoletransferase